MQYELIAKKVGNGHIIQNKVTNEPVAIATPSPSTYKKEIEVRWHPEFKYLHPEIQSNITTNNIGRKYESVRAATDHIESMAKPYVFGDEPTKDPLTAKYVGSKQVKGKYGEETHHTWNLHDDDGARVGSIASLHGPDRISADSPINTITWDKGYLDTHNIPESVKEAARKKYSGSELASTMRRMRYAIDNKTKEPRFVGNVISDKGGLKTFKTKLSPEAASAAYEEHLKSKLGGEYTFTRHSPNIFSATQPAEGVYDSSRTHHVISLPGEIQHFMASTPHPDYSGAKKNAEVIESALFKLHER